MPKKQQKNSYYYFFVEYQEREKQKGRILTKADAANEAGVIWARMGPSERQPFEARARAENDKHKKKKYTSSGEDIEVVLKREQEAKEALETMIQTIENLVISSPDISRVPFYVAHVNHYCFHKSWNKHIPCEISIIRFTLRDGWDQNDYFHVIIDIGTVPIGYRLSIDSIAAETHQISLPPHEDDCLVSKYSEKNVKKAYIDMINYLRKDLRSDEPIPPLYVDESNMQMAQDVFKNFALDYGNTVGQVAIEIFSLAQLFFCLRNSTHEDVFPITLVQEEFDKDVYDYVKGIACEFHNQTEAFPHCTLSKCIRKVFTICDFTNSLLNLPLIPGRHVPNNAKIGAINKPKQLHQIEEPLRLNENNKPSCSTVAIARPSTVAIARPSTSSGIGRPTSSTASTSSSNTQQRPYTGPKLPLHLPTSTSIAAQIPDNYNAQFPALGIDIPAPTVSIFGRGRGRIRDALRRNP